MADGAAPLAARVRALLLCTRQAGKSTATALYALHEALYGPPALVLLLSPSLRQSGELFQKVAAFYRSLAAAAVPAEHESALEAGARERVADHQPPRQGGDDPRLLRRAPAGS